ncbi:MAG: hypothetical protein V1835_05580 [Candidatus Micrarchaeota archaeon]
MITALFFILCSFLFGIACSSFLHFLDDWWKKVAFALGFGVLASTWLTFVLSWAFGSLSEISILFSSAILLGGFLRFYRHKKIRIAHDLTGLIFVLFIFAILIYLNFRLLPHIEDGGNMIAGANIWGDMPFHLGVIYSFTERPNFPPKYPILIDADLAYPFMINFLSAILIKGGLGLFEALLIPHAIFYFALIAFLYLLGCLLTKKKVVGMALVLLFLFNGNWGGYFALQDAFATNDPLNFLLHPPKAYSHIDPQNVPYGFAIHEGLFQIEFMNQIFSTFIPQRSAIMGISLSVLFYLLVLLSIKQPDRSKLFFAGAILGLLPLVHGHSFLIAAVFSPFAFAYSMFIAPEKKSALKTWLYFIIPSLLFAIPQIMFMFSQVSGADVIKYRVGWMQTGPITLVDSAVYWLRNFGLILPLALLGLVFAPNILRVLAIPAFLFFVIGNFYQLAPWDWDTIKFFGPFFMFICLFAAIALGKIIVNRKKVMRAFGFALIFFAVFSGAITLVWWHGDRPVLYWKRDFLIADWIKENTPATAIWITSDAHTHVVPSLTGRQTVLGLRWYLYSHGLDKRKMPQEMDMNRYFQTAECEIPKKYNAEYVFLGPQEESIYHANAIAFINNPKYIPVYDQVLDGQRFRIFQIGC